VNALPPSPPAPRAAVTFERLALQGFGRHRSLELRFPAGLGVWAAQNERGKTTALLGLAATLWGVPHRADPSQIGWGRYRSWFGGPHRGALTLRARDGTRFTVERSFDDHRVRVTRHDPSGDALVVPPSHNPAARVALSPYERWLIDTLGVGDGEVVMATAVVAQGDIATTPHRLSADVQRLLSGAGAGGAAAALERLADALRERTRWLRALELGLADLRQPRLLETLEAEAEVLLQRAEAGRAAADGRERAQRALSDAESELAAAQLAASRARAEAAAARAWLNARSDAERASERLLAHRSDVVRARGLRAALAAAEAALAALEARARPPQTADQELRSLDAAQRAYADALRRRDEAAAAVAEHDSRPPSDGSLGAPTPEEPWAALGPTAAELVTRAQRAARTLVRRTQAALTLRERLRGDAAALERLAVFTTLEPSALELIASFGQRERVLVERVQAARGRRDDLLERVERHRAAFAEVRHLTPQQVTALEAFDEALERRRDPRPWRVAASGALALLGAVALPVVLGLLDAPFPWAGVVGGVVGATVGALLPIGDGTARSRAMLATLGLDGDDDELRQRLRRRSAYDAQYEQVQADARALEAVEARLVEQEAEARAFLQAVEPVLVALPAGTDVDEAYQAWLRLTPLVRSARTELAALLIDMVDGEEVRLEPERFELSEIGVADGPLGDVVRVAQVVGGLPAPAERVSLATLAAWAETVDDDAWRRWLEEATESDRRLVAQRSRGREVEAERERYVAWGAALRATLASAERELTAVSAEVARARASVLRWWAAGAATEQRPAGRVAAPVAGAEAGNAVVVGPDDELLIGDDDLVAATGRAEVATVAAAPAERLGEALDSAEIAAHVARVRQAQLQRAQAERALGEHLAGLGERDGASLEERTRPLELTLETALATWRELCSRHPQLPPAELSAADAADSSGERQLDELEAAAASAEQRERQAASALLDAQRALAASASGAVENVAALLESHRERVREAAQVRDEVAALALAYRHLDASARDFVATHKRWLEARCGELLAMISERPGRRVLLDDAFAATVVEPSGDVAVPEQLSQGTRDQLALALRLAVLDRIAAEVPLPLVLDDPFLNWDAERLERARAMLGVLARERQVLLLTHRPELAAWGESIDVVDIR